MSDLDSRRFLAKPTFQTPVLFVYGMDDSTVDGAARSIIAAYRKQHADEVESETAAASDIIDDVSRLSDFLDAQSLFGQARTLWVNEVTERFSKAATTFLENAKPSTDLVVISSAVVRKSSKLLARFRDHPLCSVVSCYNTALSAVDLQKMFAARSDSSISPSALRRLTEISQNTDGQSFELFLDKLALYIGAEVQFDDKAIEEIIPLNLHNEDQGITELLLSGDRLRVLEAWRLYKLDNSDTGGLAPIIGAQLVSALNAVTRETTSQSGFRLFWKLEKTVTAASKRLNGFAARLEHAILEIQAHEKRVRTVSTSNSIETERLLLRLTGFFQR